MSIAKGEVKVDVALIVDLEKNNQTQNQTIGEQRKTIEVLEVQLQEKTKSHIKELQDLTEKLGKEVLIGTGTQRSSKCTNCGFNYYSNSCYTCPNCGSKPTYTGTQYKNLDDVIEIIRKEEGKKIKADVIKLEDENSTLSFDLERTIKKVSKLEKETEIKVTDAKTRLRERLNGIIEEKDKEITTLQEEIIKVQEDKTDIQVEEARKQEIIDLKLHVEEIEKDKETLIKLLPIWKQRIFNNKKAKRQAIIDITEKEEKIAAISNTYPKVHRANSFHSWVKFAKENINSWWAKAKTNSRFEIEEEDCHNWKKTSGVVKF